MTFGTTSSGTFYFFNKKEQSIPIVFIHGVGLTHEIWQPQLDFFKEYSSLSYDILGFTDCKNDTEVALVTIHAGTHNIYNKDDPVSSEPGTQGTVDTAQIAWDFMSKFSK